MEWQAPFRARVQGIMGKQMANNVDSDMDTGMGFIESRVNRAEADGKEIDK